MSPIVPSLTAHRRTRVRSVLLAVTTAASLAGCPAAEDAPPAESASDPVAESPPDALVAYTEERAPCDHRTPNRVALFGDLHVHTRLSFDASANTIGATPEDAYRYAQGEAIDFWPMEDGRPVGSFAIDRPLDFLAVTDHGEFLGERRLCREAGSPRYDERFCALTREAERNSMMLFGRVITAENPRRVPEVCGEDGQLCREYAKKPWQRLTAAADAAYDRTAACRFTTLNAYEYTGTPGTSNYHRNVIFRNENVPAYPVSYVDAPFDSALWEQLDAACASDAGCEYLTIPHNTNLANGRMAPYMRLAPTVENRVGYAEKRQQREPIMEIFQHKGASECINGLSSVLGEPDELCDVEAVRFVGREETYAVTRRNAAGELEMGQSQTVTEECDDGEIGSYGMLGAGCVDATDFQRSGLLVGLEEGQKIGVNPVKLGVIAATDTHAATPGAVAEADWRGHVSLETTPVERLQPGLLTSGIDGNPGGLAGVWAVENSRDAIFEAMLRRETFGTSGPRITPRFFAGWDYDADFCARADLAAAGYDGGVPMGGDLPAPPSADAKPVLVAAAMRDPSPMGTQLQQLQIVKGWIDAEGRRHTKVITVAGGPNDASVDLETGERSGDGHESLCAVYRDEDFDASLPTYYYVRAVENPSARWNVFDCMRLPEGERPSVCTDGSVPQTIQEMAWTSPIWHER